MGTGIVAGCYPEHRKGEYTLLTIFSIPKAFAGESDLLQRNAIESWRRLVPQCEVMLFGSDIGVREYAEEAGVRWMGDLPRNNFGTPLLQPAFEKANECAEHDTLCYVNSDIIILNDLVEATSLAIGSSRLLVGRRINIKVDRSIFALGESWDCKLRELAQTTGCPHGPSAMDYFIFRRNELPVELENFAVGRPLWDNWMLMQSRRRRMQVVDITAQATVLHQDHGYGHVPDRSGPRWEGPEANQHLSLLVDQAFHFDIWDATHRLSRDRIVKALRPCYLANRVISEIALLCWNRPFMRRLAWCCGKGRALLNILRPRVFGVPRNTSPRGCVFSNRE